MKNLFSTPQSLTGWKKNTGTGGIFKCPLSLDPRPRAPAARDAGYFRPPSLCCYITNQQTAGAGGKSGAHVFVCTCGSAAGAAWCPERCRRGSGTACLEVKALRGQRGGDGDGDERACRAQIASQSNRPKRGRDGVKLRRCVLLMLGSLTPAQPLEKQQLKYERSALLHGWFSIKSQQLGATWISLWPPF